MGELNLRLRGFVARRVQFDDALAGGSCWSSLPDWSRGSMSLSKTLVRVARASARASVASFTPWWLVHSDWAVMPMVLARVVATDGCPGRDPQVGGSPHAGVPNAPPQLSPADGPVRPERDARVGLGLNDDVQVLAGAFREPRSGG